MLGTIERPLADIPKVYYDWKEPLTQAYWLNRFEGQTKSNWNELVEHRLFTCFPIVTTEIQQTLVSRLRGLAVLDAGCGAGYLVQMLRNGGVNARGVDSRQTAHHPSNFHRCTFLEVEEADAADSIKDSDDVVVLSWPDHETTQGERVVEALRSGQTLIYQGEPGCSDQAFRRFHELEKTNLFIRDEHFIDSLRVGAVSFPGFADQWHVYVKK